MNSEQWRDRLSQLNETQVERYLVSAGWQKDADIGELASVWHRPPAEASDAELVLPRSGYAKDYQDRLIDLLSTLADFEQRELESVLQSLTKRERSAPCQCEVCKLNFNPRSIFMKHIGDLVITKKNKHGFSALTEVTGGLYLNEGATLTAPSLAEVGWLHLHPKATLIAPELFKVTAEIYLGRGAMINAPLLKLK